MPRGFDRDLEQRWRNRFKEFNRSGLKVREFCRKAGIREHAFFQWRRELAKRDGQASGSDRRRKRGGRESRDGAESVAAFVPVEMLESRTRSPVEREHLLEIVLPDGIRLRVPVGSDPFYVQRLLAVLGAKSC